MIEKFLMCCKVAYRVVVEPGNGEITPANAHVSVYRSAQKTYGDDHAAGRLNFRRKDTQIRSWIPQPYATCRLIRASRLLDCADRRGHRGRRRIIP